MRMCRHSFIGAALLAAFVQTAAFPAGLDALKKVAGSAQSIESGISKTASSIAVIAEDITPEQQYYIGRAVAGTVLQHYSLYEDKDATAYVNKICAALTQASDVPLLYKGYFVGILDTPEVNAISSPGGHILVTRGLLECAQDEDALAAVIAHEVAHIQLGHSVKAIKSSRTTGELVKAFEDSGSSSAQLLNELGVDVDDMVNQLVNSGYSKTQEFQADKTALSLLDNAGYDPAAMQEMLTLLKEREAGQTAGFCKNHPSADSRLKNIKSDLKKYKGSYQRTEREKRFTDVKGKL
ncbi:MAG: M48 family metallopeptidase [Treponema sp.]|nr:M48 family metallopeptidase [Treponema sp.]